MSELNFLSNVGIRLTSAVLGLGLTIILARILGPEQLGIYSFVLSIIWLLSIPSQSGLPTLAMREIATGLVQAEFGRIRGMLVWARFIVLISTTLIALATILTVSIWEDLVNPQTRATLYWGLTLVPLFSFLALNRDIMRGFGYVRIGQVPHDILRPAILIILLLVWGVNGLNVGYSEAAIALHVIASAVAVMFSVLTLGLVRQKILPAKECHPKYHTREWLSAIIPLSFAAILQQLLKQVDIVMLGAIGSDFTEVGLYRIAVQGAMLLLFLQSALNMPLAPKFTKLYKLGDRGKLQHLAVTASRAVLIFSLLGAIMFIFLGEQLIAGLFGDEFKSANQPLIILAIAQCVNASFGAVGILLNMSGNEMKNLLGVSLGLGLNIMLNALLIPLYGINGAAIATAISLITWKMFLWRQVSKTIGINCGAFVSIRQQ